MDAIKKACAWCEQFRPLVNAGLTTAAIALFVYCAWTAWKWIDDDQPVVEYLGGEISAVDSKVLTARPGDPMIAYITIRKHRNCPGVTQRRLTGDCGEHRLSEAATYLPQGFVGRITLLFQIPHQVIPGDCAFIIHTRFICNPMDLWRDRNYESPPIPFKVLRYDD